MAIGVDYVHDDFFIDVIVVVDNDYTASC